MMIYDIWAVLDVYKITCTFLTTYGHRLPPGGIKPKKYQILKVANIKILFYRKILTIMRNIVEKNV